jgi:hypothetical protein
MDWENRTILDLIENQFAVYNAEDINIMCVNMKPSSFIM